MGLISQTLTCWSSLDSVCRSKGLSIYWRQDPGCWEASAEGMLPGLALRSDTIYFSRDQLLCDFSEEIDFRSTFFSSNCPFFALCFPSYHSFTEGFTSQLMSVHKVCWSGTGVPAEALPCRYPCVPAGSVWHQQQLSAGSWHFGRVSRIVLSLHLSPQQPWFFGTSAALPVGRTLPFQQPK